MTEQNRKYGAWALIGASLLNVLIFMIHPTSGDHARLGPWEINGVTHTLGVGGLPVLLFGFWALAEWLGLDRPVVRIGLICALLSVVLTAIAGLTSGWITPAAYDLGQELWKLAMAINRACDRGYVAFMALAMLFFGLGMPSCHRPLRLYTLAIGLLPLGWVMSGSFDPRIHAMLVLAVAQVIWLIAVGRAMLTSKS
jgi:hypothetical protein